MKRLAFTVVGTASCMLLAAGVRAEELTTASLAGLTRIGAVIVTVANDTVPESDVRRAVERRLAQGKIAVDGEPGPELLVSVSAERDRAEHGPCEYAVFRISVSLREAVSLERDPSQRSIGAVTWRVGNSVRKFSRTSPRLAIMDGIEDGLSAFLRAIASDTQQAEHEKREP